MTVRHVSWQDEQGEEANLGGPLSPPSLVDDFLPTPPASPKKNDTASRDRRYSHQRSAFFLDKDFEQGRNSFLPGRWLSDSGMYLFLDLLQSALPTKYPDVAVVASASLEVHRLSMANPSSDGYNKAYLLDVAPYAGKRLFLFSLFSQAHWQVARLDTRSGEVTTYCSLGRKVTAKQLVPAKAFLYTLRGPSGVSWKSDTSLRKPRQRNSFDCGVFSLLAIWYMSQSMPMDFVQEDMPQARAWLRQICLEKRSPLEFPFKRVDSSISVVADSPSPADISSYSPSPGIYMLRQLFARKDLEPSNGELVHIPKCTSLEVLPKTFPSIPPAIPTGYSLPLRSFAAIASMIPPNETQKLLINGIYKDLPTALSFANATAKPAQVEWVVDIDSIFAHGDEIHMTEGLNFKPFPNMSLTNSRNSHIYYRSATGRRIPFFHIPNYSMGFAGPNDMFHVSLYFPMLMEKMENGFHRTMLKSHVIEKFYDEVIIQAIRHVLPVNAHKEFPINYAIATMRARTDSGNFHFSNHFIPKEYANLVLRRMQDIVSLAPHLPEFQDFFFAVHAKGVKMHFRGSANSSPEKQLMQHMTFNWDAFDSQCVFIDVGCEIYGAEEVGSLKLGTSCTPTAIFGCKRVNGLTIPGFVLTGNYNTLERQVC
jgi:hypothetical protein